MSKQKFRRKKQNFKIPRGVIFPVKQNKIVKENDQQIDHDFALSETERIRYIYTRDSKNKITSIISVTYDIFINSEWVTVIYYDSEHGFLHRHETISFQDRNDIATEENVKKKGDREIWLTWAIKDILQKSIYYKKLFLKRSNLNIDNLQ